jgi:hypothetical protein
MRRLSSIDFP